MSELAATTETDQPSAAPRRRGGAVAPIPATDGERLMRFRRHRDQTAFAEVVEAHAALVWGVCSQVLRHRQDVEDAFQATFLILARKAKSIRAADSAAGWLYRVAFRTALLARNRRNRRAELPLVEEPLSMDDQFAAISRNEQCLALLEEIHALPPQYRQPLVLCYLEGRTRREAADELGVTPQSVKGRLARGTRLLRTRLVSRGAALSTTMAVVSASMASAEAAINPTLVSQTAALASGFALKVSVGGLEAAAVKGGAACTLAEKGIVAMTIAAAAKPAVAVLGICITAGMLAVAMADTPSGGSGGAAVVLLASAGEEDKRAVNDFVETSSEDAGNEDVLLEDVAFEPASADEAPAAGNDEPAAARTIAAPAPDSPYQPARIALPAQFAPPATPVAPPADVLINTSGELPVPAIAPLNPASLKDFNVRVPGPADQFRFVMADAMAASAERSSPEALKLEREYWELKGNALKKKAEALRLKARAMDESGGGSHTEILETEAEADLTLAEVKLCEVNAQRVKDSLAASGEASDQPGQPKRDPMKQTEAAIDAKLNAVMELWRKQQAVARAADQASAAEEAKQASALRSKYFQLRRSKETIAKHGRDAPAPKATLKASRAPKAGQTPEPAGLAAQLKALKAASDALQQQIEILEESAERQNAPGRY